jgi:hypothetical protein
MSASSPALEDKGDGDDWELSRLGSPAVAVAAGADSNPPSRPPPRSVSMPS